MAAERHLSVVPDPAPVWAYDALLDLLAEDEEATARFGEACRQHVIFPDAVVLALRSALSRGGQRCHYEDVEAALYSLALAELPESCAAGRERLRLHVYDRHAEVERTAITAVEDLVATETVWLRELWLIAEDSPSYDRLREVSARVWGELRRRGKDFEPEHFSEHLHEVLCIIFPYAPATAWDQVWANDLYERAEQYLEEHGIRDALTAEEEAAYVERTFEAIGKNDRRGYRCVLREWIDACRAEVKVSGEKV